MMHAVMILPGPEAGTSEVKVAGKTVGIIRLVEAAAPFEGFDGTMHMGERWIPEGLPTDLIGPVTPGEAALLLLALEGHDPEAVIERLRLAA